MTRHCPQYPLRVLGIHEVTHSFSYYCDHVLSTYCVPGTIPGAEDKTGQTRMSLPQ